MWNAVARQGARVMTFERLALFREAIKGFTIVVRENNGHLDTAVVESNLTQFGLAASMLEDRWTQKFKDPAAKKQSAK